MVTTSLAKMIVKDGEGATKFVEVRVQGAKTAEDARCIAKTVASSNLVKTAVFGRILIGDGSWLLWAGQVWIWIGLDRRLHRRCPCGAFRNRQ